MNARTRTIAAAAALAFIGTSVSAAHATSTPTIERGARSVNPDRGDKLTTVPEVETRVLSNPVGAAGYRISGADRYETAVEISRNYWDAANTGVVYIASGTSFADALAAGASAHDGPILLTERDALPQVTRTELAALEPCYVVILGGPAVISDRVAAEVSSYARPELCA